MELGRKMPKCNFQENPEFAWKMVFKLIKGFQGHHKSFIPKIFKNSKGKTVKDPKENIENLKAH
jgi:hypothetical protein